jgi:hypothetical protein
MRLGICLAVAIYWAGTAQAGVTAARNLNSFVGQAERIATSTYRGEAASEPRTLRFSHAEGTSQPTDAEYLERLAQRADLEATYRVCLEIDDNAAVRSDQAGFQIEAGLPRRGGLRWKHYLTQQEIADCKAAVEEAEQAVEQDYRQRAYALQSRLRSINTSIMYCGRYCSKSRYTSDMAEKRAVERQLRGLKSEMRRAQKVSAAQEQASFKALAEERQQSCANVRVVLHVPKDTVRLANWEDVRRIDAYVRIDDFEIEGHVANYRHDSYCRELLPRLSTITVSATEVRRVTTRR